MKRICIVEDDREIRSQLSEFLKNNGYACEAVTDFTDVPGIVAAGEPDMVLLDLALPGADGGYILREIRAESDVPVIIVTSKNTEMDEVVCMSLGADDFITKPYNPALLLLHIEAVFKRLSRGGETDSITACGIRLDTERGSMEILSSPEKGPVELTRNEMGILLYLMKNRGRIVTREELISYLWNSEEFVDDNTLTVNINRVRGKLKDNGVEDLIRTKRGIGYLLG